MTFFVFLVTCLKEKENKMKKKYLKTPEDVMALKDTDTKIYIDVQKGCYFKFIDGLLCWFDEEDENTWMLNTRITEGNKAYILEEDPMQEATEEDVGKLCTFWNDDENDKKVDILKEIDKRFHQKFVGNICYFHCRRLTPSEVAELTGYKVEEKE